MHLPFPLPLKANQPLPAVGAVLLGPHGGCSSEAGLAGLLELLRAATQQLLKLLSLQIFSGAEAEATQVLQSHRLAGLCSIKAEWKL